MKTEAIDSAYLAVPDLDACGPYVRLGLSLSPTNEGRRTLRVGGRDNPFDLHFVAAADGPLARPRADALAAGRPLFAVGFRVANLDDAVRGLEARGVHGERFRDGESEAAWLPLHEQAGTDLVLVQGRHLSDIGSPGHSFPLLRLDHLAAIVHDLDEKSRFWAEGLGVPVTGEVATPAMVIRQLKLGDAVLELLGPATPDSPVWRRPTGLVGMASWEVADLDAAVGLARAAGLTVSDPATGPLPGTRIATAQGDGLAGLNMQLLRYV